MLRFQGINSAPGQIQRFKGAYRVRGNGDINTERSECKVTQGDPQDMEVADRGYISVGLGRSHPAGSNAASPASPSQSNKNDILEQKYRQTGVA
jgi:hypothetical protein